MKIGIIGRASQAHRYQTALRERFIEPVNLTADIRQALIREDPTSSLREIIHASKLIGLVIATPPHVQLAVLKAIQDFDVPMILEKPLACSYSELNDLKSLEKLQGPVFVNHPHLFDKGLNDFLSISHSDSSRRCSDIHKLVVVEGGLGPFRTNVSAFFDWGIHAVVACIAIFGEMPLDVSCESAETMTQNGGGAWEMTITFSDTRSASLLFGNILPKKVRTIEGLDRYGKQVLSSQLPDDLWGVCAPASRLVDSFLALVNSGSSALSTKPTQIKCPTKNSFELSVRGLELMMPYAPSPV
tara:strand:- start:522 stop:1421 length:900 start_codon:yes stop_codon:yes gene_type:complete